MKTELRGKKPYVYQVQRIGKKVVKTYVGPALDPVVAVVARTDRLERATHAAEHRANQQDLLGYAAVEPCVRLIATKLARMVWRWRRQQRQPDRQQNSSMFKGRQPVIARSESSANADINRDDFDEMVSQATAGSDEALRELRKVLQRNSAVRELLGDLSRHVQQHLINLLTNGRPLETESLRLTVAAKRSELGFDAATPLEKLVIEQVVTTWLDVHFQQLGMSLAQRKTDAKHWEQRLGRAQKRHLAAVTALAEMRGEQA